MAQSLKSYARSTKVPHALPSPQYLQAFCHQPKKSKKSHPERPVSATDPSTTVAFSPDQVRINGLMKKRWAITILTVSAWPSLQECKDELEIAREYAQGVTGEDFGATGLNIDASCFTWVSFLRVRDCVIGSPFLSRSAKKTLIFAATSSEDPALLSSYDTTSPPL